MGMARAQVADREIAEKAVAAEREDNFFLARLQSRNGLIRKRK